MRDDVLNRVLTVNFSNFLGALPMIARSVMLEFGSVLSDNLSGQSLSSTGIRGQIWCREFFS